jgi:hypothetical protein
MLSIPAIFSSQRSVLWWSGFLVILALAPNSGWAANLFTNSSFETGAWGGAQTFVNPSNATTLSNSSTTVTGWTTSTGSTWVQDVNRATDLNRMIWLGAPAFGACTCLSQKVSLFSSGDPSTQLMRNNTYTMLVDAAFFDPTDPTASLAGLSTLQMYYVLGTNGGGDDPFSISTIFETTGSVSPWSNGFGGSGLQWNESTVTFTVPSAVGYDYMRFFLGAPKATGSTPSRGVLVDNASLTLATAAIPEPGSVTMLASLALGLVGRRRRR